MRSSPPSDPSLDARLRILVQSYDRLIGKPLLPASPLTPFTPFSLPVGEGVFTGLGERESLEKPNDSTFSRACVVGALAPYNHGLPLAGVTLPDGTTSHSTRLASNASLVAGYLQGGGDEAEAAANLREALWTAPFAIVAHGTEAAPIFFYGNRYALDQFEMSFSDFTRLPSRLSAEPANQEAREQSLRKVTERGYIDGYSGMRIASSGRRFLITNCTIWNLADEAGVHHGQAAVFVAAA